jgi:hypothetical protein
MRLSGVGSGYVKSPGSDVFVRGGLAALTRERAGEKLEFSATVSLVQLLPSAY